MKLKRSESAYYLESYVPSWLAQDLAFCNALRARVQQLMEAHDWTVNRIVGPELLRWKEYAIAAPPAGFEHVIVTAVVSEFDSWVGTDGDDLVDVDPLPIPMKVQTWEAVGDVLDECSKCGQLVEIPEPPKDGEVVVCDDCKSKGIRTVISGTVVMNNDSPNMPVDVELARLIIAAEHRRGPGAPA